MKVRCSCGAAYDIPNELLGKSVRCQKCSRNFVATVSTPPAQQPTVPMTTEISQKQSGPGSAQRSATGSSAAPTPATARSSSDAKERDEREKKIMSQYVQYKPKPGSKLRGKALKKVEMKLERRERLGGMLRLVCLGLGLIAAAIFGYFKLDQMEATGADAEDLNWIMSLLYTIGGKWTAAIGLGLIAFGCIGYGLLFWYGIVGRKAKR